MGKKGKIMTMRLLLEQRHVLLKSELNEKLQEKHALELEISKQFEELKKLETTLEKQNSLLPTDRTRHDFC